MRTMYDSTAPLLLPSWAQMVAGYVDGRFAWPASGWARFAHVPTVQIAVSAATNAGTCLDVERYDAFPWEAPGWCQRRRAAGVTPSVYVSASLWAATRTEFQSRGVAEPYWWVADWDDQPNLPAGAIAHQYTHPPASGGDFDVSVCADFWPGVDLAAGDVGGTVDDDMTPLQAAQLATVHAILTGETPSGWLTAMAQMSTVYKVLTGEEPSDLLTLLQWWKAHQAEIEAKLAPSA